MRAARNDVPLGRDEVHVWWVRPEGAAEPELRAAYDRLMTEEERAKQQRFYFEKGRHECLVTRALVRTTLSRYADVAPEVWRFTTNRWGCPRLLDPPTDLPLRFNLTHTDGLIACAVALERDVGVDVEATDRPGETVEIADRFFSVAEYEELVSQPPERQQARFFDYWTLKEAYIKARGMGLAIPLGQFTYRLRDGAPIGIEFGPELDDDPAAWQFAQFAPTERHALAVAVRRGAGGGEVSIQLRETLPLRW